MKLQSQPFYMTARRVLLTGAISIAALAGLWLLFTPRQSASELLTRYVFSQIPGTLKVQEFDRSGHREWTAFVRFSIAPEDMPRLFQDNNPVRIDPTTLPPDDSAVAAIRLFERHVTNADLAKSYEVYALRGTNTITENYLAVNKDNSEGLVVMIRY